MNIEQPITNIEQKVQELLATEPGYFLVEVKINSGNNIKIFIDADQGASIDKLVPYNRQLYKWIEESGAFPADNFSLEVSSPGLEEPLKLHRQYLKNIGRNVEVTKIDDSKIEGKLVSVAENELVVETEQARGNPKNKNTESGQGKGKKKEMVPQTIPFDTIKTITVQIKF